LTVDAEAEARIREKVQYVEEAVTVLTVGSDSSAVSRLAGRRRAAGTIRPRRSDRWPILVASTLVGRRITPGGN